MIYLCAVFIVYSPVFSSGIEAPHRQGFLYVLFTSISGVSRLFPDAYLAFHSS